MLLVRKVVTFSRFVEILLLYSKKLVGGKNCQNLCAVISRPKNKRKKKFRRPLKLEGGGCKALMARPLKIAASLRVFWLGILGIHNKNVFFDLNKSYRFKKKVTKNGLPIEECWCSVTNPANNFQFNIFNAINLRPHIWRLCLMFYFRVGDHSNSDVLRHVQLEVYKKMKKHDKDC